VKLTLRQLFSAPTVAALAEEIARLNSRRRPKEWGTIRAIAIAANFRRPGGCAAEPLSPARSRGAGQSLPALPAPANGRSGSLGRLPPRLGGHALSGCHHGP